MGKADTLSTRANSGEKARGGEHAETMVDDSSETSDGQRLRGFDDEDALAGEDHVLLKRGREGRSRSDGSLWTSLSSSILVSFHERDRRFGVCSSAGEGLRGRGDGLVSTTRERLEGSTVIRIGFALVNGKSRLIQNISMLCRQTAVRLEVRDANCMKSHQSEPCGRQQQDCCWEKPTFHENS